MTNIFVVDDNQLMRQQALRLLEQQDSWQVSGEAVNGKDAVSKYRDLLPDVTVMDFEMPEMNGLDAAREILREHPKAAILMLSVHLPGQLAIEARRVGIKGACPKSEMWCLPDAIRALLRGETYFPHQNCIISPEFTDFDGRLTVSAARDAVDLLARFPSAYVVKWAFPEFPRE